MNRWWLQNGRIDWLEIFGRIAIIAAFTTLIGGAVVGIMTEWPR